MICKMCDGEFYNGDSGYKNDNVCRDCFLKQLIYKKNCPGCEDEFCIVCINETAAYNKVYCIFWDYAQNDLQPVEVKKTNESKFWYKCNCSNEMRFLSEFDQCQNCTININASSVSALCYRHIFRKGNNEILKLMQMQCVKQYENIQRYYIQNFNSEKAQQIRAKIIETAIQTKEDEEAKPEIKEVKEEVKSEINEVKVEVKPEIKEVEIMKEYMAIAQNKIIQQLLSKDNLDKIEYIIFKYENKELVKKAITSDTSPIIDATPMCKKYMIMDRGTTKEKDVIILLKKTV